MAKSNSPRHRPISTTPLLLQSRNPLPISAHSGWRGLLEKREKLKRTQPRRAWIYVGPLAAAIRNKNKPDRKQKIPTAHVQMRNATWQRGMAKLVNGPRTTALWPRARTKGLIAEPIHEYLCVDTQTDLRVLDSAVQSGGNNLHIQFEAVKRSLGGSLKTAKNRNPKNSTSKRFASQCSLFLKKKCEKLLKKLVNKKFSEKINVSNQPADWLCREVLSSATNQRFCSEFSSNLAKLWDWRDKSEHKDEKNKNQKKNGRISDSSLADSEWGARCCGVFLAARTRGTPPARPVPGRRPN